jgi:hypothetical protein
MSSAVVFIGKSGERYRFDVYSLSNALPAVAAVYVVTRRTFDDRTFATRGTHRTLAIGETANLAATFIGKADLKSLEARGATSICIYAVADEKNRLRIEQDLIEGNEKAGGSLRFLFDLVDSRDKREPPVSADPAP